MEKPKFETEPASPVQAHAAIVQAQCGGTPGDQRADRNGHQARRDAPEVTHAAKPADHDDREADEADQRRHEHFQRRAHRDERDGNAGQRAEQCRARCNFADPGSDEATDHEHEALNEYPGQARFPALDRIAGLAA